MTAKDRDKCRRLLADNRRLTKMVNGLRSSLDIWRQKCCTMEAAFDLSQKLVQHLKIENQLLRSSSPDLYPMPPSLTVDTHLEPICDSPIVDNKVTDIVIGCENKPTEMVINDGQTIDETMDQNNEQSIFSSDMVAIEYENEIKELREDWQLLSLIDLEEVVISVEDQNNANSYLAESSDSEDDEPLNNRKMETINHTMDIDFDAHSEANTSEMSETWPQKCKYCGRKFWDESSISQHKVLHKTLTGKQIRCAEDMCGYQFDSKHDLHRHLKTVHKNHGKAVYSQLKAKFKSPLEPKCLECDKVYESVDELRAHQKSFHNIKSTFKCKFSGCDKTFEKSSELRAHEVIHRKQKSKIGFKATPTKTEVKEENNDENTPKSDPAKDRPFKCQFKGCNKSFVIKISLKRHEEKVHANDILVRDSEPVSGALPAGDTPVLEKSVESINVGTNEMSNQLQLLEMFYAVQQKQAEV